MYIVNFITKILCITKIIMQCLFLLQGTGRSTQQNAWPFSTPNGGLCRWHCCL